MSYAQLYAHLLDLRKKKNELVVNAVCLEDTQSQDMKSTGEKVIGINTGENH